METLNLYNHSNQLKEELKNNNANINFYNKKYCDNLSTKANCNVNSYYREREKFNEDVISDISFENAKMKNYSEKTYKDQKNEKHTIPVEMEQNECAILNNDKNYEIINKLYQNNISNINEYPRKFKNTNFYFNKKSHLEIDKEEKQGNNMLERNGKLLKDQYVSQFKSQIDTLKKYNSYISDGCTNNIQADSQQTIAYDSQQNLMDMYQNNFHVNSQQTLKCDSEQNLPDFFQNNSYTNPKPTLIFESENNEYKWQRIPLTMNSKHPNNPYVKLFEAHEKPFINKDKQSLASENEKNSMKNEKEQISENEHVQKLENEHVQKLESENVQKLENENVQTFLYEHDKLIKKEDEEILKNGREQNMANQRRNNTSNTYGQIWDEPYLNNIYNVNEQYQQNALNSYEQNYEDIKRVNIEDTNKNKIYDNHITNRYNNDKFYLNNPMSERDYCNNYGITQQNNYLLAKTKFQNCIQKPYISSNSMKHNLKEKNNGSGNGFMTVRTLNMNSSNKKMKENQLQGLNNLHSTRSVFSKTDMYNNNNTQKFKNNNSYVMNINSLKNMNAPFYEKKVPYEMNTVINTSLDEIKNTSTMFHNVASNKNSNLKNNQKYLNGKQYLSKYLDNHYKIDEIRNCMPEPTLYTKQNFDVPQIIHGLTTKHNNGIVSDCNHDTIIEYDNTWRLIQGKSFAINQNDNFKSVEDSAEAFQKYLDKKNENTKKILMNSNFNSLTGKLIIKPVYDENKNNMNKIHDYKDTLHAYPSYFSIPRHCEQNGSVAEKNNLKDVVENKITLNKNENNDYNNNNEKITKKKTMVKKQNLALCGDYLLKHRIKDFISVKMKDYFNINLFNHYI